MTNHNVDITLTIQAENQEKAVQKARKQAAQGYGTAQAFPTGEQ